jgi:hypothetical protein
MQLSGGSDYVPAIGIGRTDYGTGGLSRTPPGLIGTGWIVGDAQAPVTP